MILSWTIFHDTFRCSSTDSQAPGLNTSSLQTFSAVMKDHI